MAGENGLQFLGLNFEDILPWGVVGGDTGLSARLKIKRNFDKIQTRFNADQALYLSKINDDTAQGFIRFIRGLQVGERFVTGLLGEGGIFRKEADGTTYIEADKLYIRMKAYFDSVEIRDYKHSAGNRIASPAGARCCRVDWIDASGNSLKQTSENLSKAVLFRCYFRGSDGEDEVRNNFVVGDQAYCHVTTVETADDSPEAKGLNMKHYWRLVVGRNPHGTLTDNDEHWIDLSNRANETLTIASNTYTHAGYQTGSDIPTAQDDIIQLGNIYDTDRMGAIIEFVTGADAPSYQIFQDINDFNLNGKNYIALGYSTQTGRAYLNVYGDTFIGDPEESTYIRYNAKTKKLDVKATVTFVSPTTHEDTTIEDFAAAVTSDINTMQNQIDGTIETWFYNGVPGDSTLPESQWKAIDEAAGNNNERLKHLGDMYYNNQTGYAYRYANQGTESQPQFVWTPISDSAVVKALADAAKAQDTADHKRRVFLTTPTPPYDAGDMWVNAVWPASGESQGSTYNNDILRCKTAKTSTQSFSINDWGLASKYTDDSALNYFIENTYAQDVEIISTQIDKKAETWYQDGDPSDAWTTDELKSEHVGDIWCDTSSNGGKKTWIYRDRGEGQDNRYYWAEQSVPDDVFDQIDGKAAIYVNTVESPPSNYHEKDLWILPADATINGVAYKIGDVLNASQDSITYNAAHWSKKVRYTDDTALNDFVNNTYNSFVSDIKSQVDGKAETWYQETDPSTNWTSTDLKNQHKGDIWHNTSSTTINGVEAGRDAIWTGTGWKMSDVPQSVYDTIDGKADIFVTRPTTYNKFDMWIINISNSSTYMPDGCVTGDIVIAAGTGMPQKRVSDYQKTDWVKKDRYTDDGKVNEIINKYGNILGITSPTAENVGEAVAYLDGILKHPAGTTIDGGLVLTSLIAMRGTESTPKVWGGMNGAYQSNETGTGYKGHGIAAWYGGAMVDHEVSTTATDYAKSLFRFDGSGYVASGNLSWDKNGNVTLQGYSVNATTLTANGSAVATESMLANYLPLSAGSDKKLTGTLYAQTILPKTDNAYNLGGISNYWKYIYVKRIYLAADVYLEYDSSNTSVKLNGSLYATGGISALGAGSGGGGDIVLAEPLSSINGAGLGTPKSANVGLVWNGSSWTYGAIGTGSGTVTAVKVGTTTYNPSSGVVSLPAYLPLTGGTMSNTNLVANLNAELLNGLSSDDFGRRYERSINANSGVKITFTDERYGAIVSVRGTSSIYRLVLLGNGYGVSYSRNHWVCLSKGSGVDWCINEEGTRTIEVFNHKPDGAINIDVLLISGGTVTFSDISALSQTAISEVVALTSQIPTNNNQLTNGAGYITSSDSITGNAGSATKLQTARSIWGQIFDGTDNVKDTLYLLSSSATGINSDSAKLKFNPYAPDSDAVVRRSPYIQAVGSYGGYGRKRLSVFQSNAANYTDEFAEVFTILPTGSVGIGTTSPAYKLHVAGTFYASGNSSIGGTFEVTGATTLSSTLDVAGLLTASGGITIPSGKTLTIGDAVLSWDATNQGIKITKGLYSETFISALGTGSSSGTATTLATLADVNVTGAKNDDVLTYNSTTKKWEAKAVQTGTDMATVWAELGASTTNQINASHLTNALGSYAQKTELAKYLPLTAGSGNRITGFMYLSRQVSTTTSYTQTENRIYYTTPDSIDEYLLRVRIRNNGTNNYSRIYYITPFSSITSHDVAAGTQGYTTLALGNATLITAENSKCGRIILYGTSNTDTTTVYYGMIAPTVFTANRTYTLPNASGTIALTSDLGGYLPLTGGTLTGNLTIIHNNGLAVQTNTGSSIDIRKDDGAEGEHLAVNVYDAKNNYTTAIFDYYTGNKNVVFGTHSINNVNFYGQNAIFYTGTAYTGDSGTQYTERMRILKSGNINIGDTPSADPGVKLNVVGNVKATTFIGALQGNADSATTASKLSVVSKKAWGQTYWTSGGIPTTISGNMTSVGSISMSGSISGATTISASTSLYVCNIRIENYDEINNNIGGVHLQYSSDENVSLCRGGGKVAIGHDDPSYKLDVSGVIYSSTGVYTAGYVTALSDIRKKEIKGGVGLTVEDVANAPSVKFLWKDKRKDGMQVGSIAQYWQKVLPEAVIDDSDGVLSMSYGVIALLASIATARKVQDHERRISELESENKWLKRQLEDKCQ